MRWNQSIYKVPIKLELLYINVICIKLNRRRKINDEDNFLWMVTLLLKFIIRWERKPIASSLSRVELKGEPKKGNW